MRYSTKPTQRRRNHFRRLFYRGGGWLIICCLLLAGLPQNSVGLVASNWTQPSAVTLEQVGVASPNRTHGVLNSNISCMAMTYQLVNGSTLEGCFVETAYGSFDIDQSTAHFPGSPAMIKILPPGGSQVLTPWPGTDNALSLTTLSTGGSALGLYKNLPTTFQDIYAASGTLTGKQVTRGPDMMLRDAAGQQLVVNPQTLTFSSGGWLVAETLGGAFVRINLSSLEAVPFAVSYRAINNGVDARARIAISRDGRYIAVASVVNMDFRVYDLSACTSLPIQGLTPLPCPSHNYWSDVSNQIAGLRTLNDMRFVNDSTLVFNATGNSGIYHYALSPSDHIDSLMGYIGLGDSYTSGEGAYDYIQDTDSADNHCHLSSKAYPALLTNDLFGAGNGQNVACSGATSSDILPTNPLTYAGQAEDGVSLLARNADSFAQMLASFRPGYLPQLDFVANYLPGVVTVSVGGNDIGFGQMLATCVAPHLAGHLSDQDCFNTYEDRQELLALIDRTVPSWTKLYQELAASDPKGRVYVIGYPQIADDTGNCATNVHLSKQELAFTAEVIDYLNKAITQAANDAGVQYVDISQALYGHRLCEARSYDVAVNGLTAGNDHGASGIGILGNESYHPNQLGHQLIEQAILRQTHNFHSTDPAIIPSGPSASMILANAPKLGRPGFALTPVSNLSDGQVGAGGSLVFHITNGESLGLKPNTTYIVHLDSPVSPAIGSLTTNDTASVTGQVSIPTNTTTGGHIISVTGLGQGGEQLAITQPIVIVSGDTDNDGIPNANDSCPSAINSGLDEDQDGIDDSCDSFIGLPPAPTTTSPPPSSSPPSISQTPPSSQPPLVEPTPPNPQPTTTTPQPSAPETLGDGMLQTQTPTVTTPQPVELNTTVALPQMQPDLAVTTIAAPAPQISRVGTLPRPTVLGTSVGALVTQPGSNSETMHRPRTTTTEKYLALPHRWNRRLIIFTVLGSVCIALAWLQLFWHYRGKNRERKIAAQIIYES